MPGDDHKPDFPEPADVAAFIVWLYPRPDAKLAVAVDRSFNTVEKWYRSPAGEISATNLLRIVRALGAEKRLAEWLATFTKPVVPTIQLTPDRDVLAGLHTRKGKSPKAAGRTRRAADASKPSPGPRPPKEAQS